MSKSQKRANSKRGQDDESVGARCGGTETPLRTDEFPEAEMERIAMRYRLVCLMEQGVSPREALKQLGIAKSPRWARRMRSRYAEAGLRGLRDNRRRNSRPVSALTPEVRKLILQWWAGRPAAGPKAIWRKVREECQRLGLPAPSYSSVYRFIVALPKPLKLARAGELATWDKTMRPVTRVTYSNYSNERFQLDHTALDIWVREWDGNEWVVRQPWCTVVLDEFSRSVAGLVVSTKHPDAWTTSILLMHAVRPKDWKGWRNRGLPAVVQPDRGKDFMSHAVQAVFAQLHVVFDPDPPHYPDGKGKVERWFRTLDTGCLRLLPGHKEAVGRTEGAATKRLATLLTRAQLLEEIQRWITEDYHQRTHSETQRKPAELWEETVRLRIPEEDDVFNVLLLKADQHRRVRNTGIDFANRRYWAPALVEWGGKEVQLRYNPEDLDSVLVYDAVSGEYVCEAWRMGGPDARYSVEDMKRERRNFRRGLVTRLREYREEVQKHDRRAAREAEWEDARALRDQMEAEEPEPPADEAAEVQNLVDMFRRQDRGEL